jgi:hypothetical protein
LGVWHGEGEWRARGATAVGGCEEALGLRNRAAPLEATATPPKTPKAPRTNRSRSMGRDGSRNEPSRRRGVDGDGEDRVGGVAAVEEATRF